MVHINFHILLGLLFFVVNLTGLNAEPIKLNENQFHESLAEKVKISGSVRAGVMYASDSTRVLPNALYVAVGKEYDKMLCVKILSVDGQYGASIKFTLKGAIEDDPAQFELPTAHQDIVTSYMPEQIAVLAQIKPVKDNCNGKSGRIVPAAWGKHNNDIIKVFLNSSANKTSLKLKKINKDGSKQSKKVLCRPVKSKNNTAYNTECSIENIGDFDLTKTKVLRSNFGSISKPIKLEVYIPQSTL